MLPSSRLLPRSQRSATHSLVIAAAALLALAAWIAAPAAPTLSIVPGEQMRMNLAQSSVVANGAQWNVTLYMANDNDYADGVLPTGFRRWWNVRIADLNTTTGETLNVKVTHTEISDVITPVWSLDEGVTWSRISTTPTVNGSSEHSFTLMTPPGVASIRLAKWYPVTLAQHDAWRAQVRTSPYVTETQIGESFEGRPMWMFEITDPTVPAAGKKRVWIHCAVHCSENTAYFNAQGLVTWLTDASPSARGLLAGTIINIVPMANPDGVAAGNYRVATNGVNLENEWTPPYDSTQPEIIAMQSKIEEYMGTAQAPGANPIVLLLNLHATHNVTYPFHFVHQANWPTNGVTSAVRTLELKWVNALRARSAFVNAGGNQSSTLSGRVYVESMMHDRYSVDPSGAWDPVMAITLEGTYQRYPGRSAPNTDGDYRQMGRDIGLAMLDYFALSPASVSGWILQ